MDEKKKWLTFKQLVVEIANAENGEDEFWRVGHEINLSFEHEKITWQDHEMLWKLAEKAILG